MFENRLNERLMTYWNNIRKEALMPDFAHFNSSTIDDIWQKCLLFVVQPSVDGKAASVSFHQIGDQLKSLYSSEVLGRVVHPTLKHFQGAAVVRKIGDVLAKPAPLIDTGQFINEKSKLVKYRSCLLPFGRDGKVTHIIVGLSWKEF